jgi:acyl-CoA thioester hydrolase
MNFDPPEDPSDYPYAHPVRVRFCETDAMAVVHHAAYLAYLEESRVAYLRALGHPYDQVRAGGVEFPVLEVAVSYRRPLRFDDLVDVHVALTSARAATFQMDYLLRARDRAETCATAVTVHAVVDGQGRAARVPAWLRDLPGQAQKD